jgi:hypothetical protein
MRMESQGTRSLVVMGLVERGAVERSARRAGRTKLCRLVPR